MKLKMKIDKAIKSKLILQKVNSSYIKIESFATHPLIDLKTGRDLIPGVLLFSEFLFTALY